MGREACGGRFDAGLAAADRGAEGLAGVDDEGQPSVGGEAVQPFAVGVGAADMTWPEPSAGAA